MEKALVPGYSSVVQFAIRIFENSFEHYMQKAVVTGVFRDTVCGELVSQSAKVESHKHGEESNYSFQGKLYSLLAAFRSLVALHAVVLD